MSDIRLALSVLSQLINAYNEAEPLIINQALTKNKKSTDAQNWLKKYSKLRKCMISGKMEPIKYTEEDLKSTLDDKDYSYLFDIEY
jgi:hypothetical protein